MSILVRPSLSLVSRTCTDSIQVAKRVGSIFLKPIAKSTYTSLVLQRVAGKDASKQFWKYHNESILKKYKSQLQVGSLDSKKAAAAAPPTPPATPPPAEQKNKVVPSAESGTVAPAPGPAAGEEAEALDPYGALIPYADPSWYQSVGWISFSKPEESVS
jgi:hypothetical protein